MNGAGAQHMSDSLFSGSFGAMEWWLVIGFLGQALFFMRFVVQWIVSEKSGRSVVPEVFWYFSLGGGLILFVYAVHRHDPVFMLGQGVGLFVYIRNIMLVHRHKQTRAASPTDIEPE